MHKTTIFINVLLTSYSISKVLNVTSVKVNCEYVTSEWVLNESVTMARTCSFVETCEVSCSVAPKNNAMKGAMFYHIPGMEICPG